MIDSSSNPVSDTIAVQAAVSGEGVGNEPAGSALADNALYAALAAALRVQDEALTPYPGEASGEPAPQLLYDEMPGRIAQAVFEQLGLPRSNP